MNYLTNRVQLIGNLGKDVEFKQLENGNAIARATIATREYHRHSNGERTIDVQWHHLVGWGRIAEIMHVLLKKGTQVAVDGKLTHRSYEDREGNTRYLSEVVVNEFILLKK